MTPQQFLAEAAAALGDLSGWWPADGPFEVAVGALLVQAVAWRNAGLAIAALKERGLLAPASLAEASHDAVAAAIRPALFHQQKAGYLQSFARFVQQEFSGDLTLLSSRALGEQERLLLALPGVGPETAAAIMVYALGEAVPVVDAYALRILARVGASGAATPSEAYATMAAMIDGEAATARLVHAAVVELGRRYCRPQPLCLSCPLTGLCPKILGHPARGRGDHPGRNAGRVAAQGEARDRTGGRTATPQRGSRAGSRSLGESAPGGVG